MFAFHHTLNRNRRFALLLNALVIASLLFSSFSTVTAQDGSTPEPTAPPQEEPLATPDPTQEPTVEPTIEPTAQPAEPTVEPTLVPTIEPTTEPTAEPTLEPTTEPPVEGGVEPQGTIPANDLVANAIRVYMDTEYTMETSGATITAEDVENVCSAGDIRSVWYKFTPAASGIYEFSAAGSTFSPNLSVLRYVSSTSRVPIACNRPQVEFDGFYHLAFNASAGVTYLVRVSDNIGGFLKLTVTRRTCPPGSLCGAAIGGDGQVIHNPWWKVLDASGKVRASGGGENGGFLEVKSKSAPLTGKFTIVTFGRSLDYSLVINNNVTIPGVYLPSAIGYPSFRVNLVDELGNPKYIGNLALTAATNPNLGGKLDFGFYTAKVYAPTGIYHLGAISMDNTLVVYKPGIFLASNEVPGSVLLDPAPLDKAKFTFTSHGVDQSYVDFNIGSDVSLEWNFTTSSTFTCAAPAGTLVKAIKLEGYKLDTSNPPDDYFFYTVLDDSFPIYNGDAHDYDFGGTFTYEIKADAPLYRLDESGGTITQELKDAYGNVIYDLLGYTSSISGAIAPDYELYRQDDSAAHDEFEPQQLTDPYHFAIEDSDPPGSWRVASSIDVGPLGGKLEDEVVFDVAARDASPQDYDEFATALDVSGMTNIGPVKTLNYTTASYDPLIPALGSKGYASAWFKYIPAASGYLNIDTFGSEYNTVLNVWQGAPGAFSNRAYNDDYASYQSLVGLSVLAGQTYYIEVTQYDLAPRDPGVQSLEEGDVTIEQIGGKLYLNLEWLPCYSVTTSVTPSTGGTVTRSPAPNCLGSKYSQGTTVTLTAAPKTGYDFSQWEGTIFTDNPLIYSINGDIVKVARFTPVPGKPALKSPAAGALVHAQDVVTFEWYASAPAANTYELQLSTDPAFSGGTVHMWIDLIATFYPITPGFFTQNTTYYWRVRGVSTIGQVGAWSLTRSLRVAVPPPPAVHYWGSGTCTDKFNAPGNYDGDVNSAAPCFTWDAVTDATGYTLQISRNLTWSSLVGTYTIAKDRTNYLPAANLPGGIQYYWRVRANASRGPSSWAEGVPFTVPPAPPVPAPASPASNALTTDYTPLFNWSDVVPAASQPALDYYEIEIEIANGNNTFLIIQNGRSSINESQFEFLESLDANKSYYWHVRSCNVVHNCSAWFAGRKLRTAVEPPVLLTPLDSTTPTTNRPEFTWQSVPGASGYTIQISRYQDFRSLVTSGTLTGNTNTRFTPAVNLPAPLTTADWLYWRVRANSATNGPGEWSYPIPWRFMVPAAPPIPVLVSPANGALITILDPTLDWNDVISPAGTPDVSGYYVQFSDDKTFTSAPEQWAFVSNYHLPELQPNKTYYWRVRTVNTDSFISGWSAARSFRTAIETPNPYGVYDEYNDLNGSDPPYTNRPEIRWSSVTGASSYTIQLSRYPNFSSLLTSATVSANVYYTNVTLPAGVPIYYCVRANPVSGAFGPSGWMTPAPFTPSYALPIPAPVSPANNALVTGTTVRLDWTDVVMPTGKIHKGYILEVDENPNFQSPPDKYILGSGVSFKDVPLVPTRTYYWRVRSRDTDGYLSGWSAVRSVRAAVEAPLLLGPMYGGVNDLRPPFMWAAVDGASGYTLQISRNAAFSSLVGTYTRSALQWEYTPLVDLPANTVIYWRVRANSPTHGPGAWASAWFTTPNPPSTPLLLTPANGAVLTDRSPLLDWTTSTLPAGTEFDHYLLNVCDYPDCSGGVIDKEIHSLTSSYYDFGSTELSAGTYSYWRVRAQNKAGAISAWSAVRMFRVSP